MIKNKINISGKTREKSKKSNLNFEQFKEKINSTNMNISQFSKYFGISRATIYGWNLHGIPVYIERILELLETKKQLNIGINKLYEINTNENNKAINKAITDTEKLKTDWTYVVEYFANEASKVVKDSDIKVKPKLEVETEDEFVYD